MLRPRDLHDQRVLEARLQISPAPEGLHFIQDEFGNHIGVAWFSALAEELRVESLVRLEHSPCDVDCLDLNGAAGAPSHRYGDSELQPLSIYLDRHYPDPHDEVGGWARRFLPTGAPIGTFENIARLSQGIKSSFAYRRREAKGIQPPAESLRIGQGSCRDFAVLMIDAVRALGVAARFASGYLAIQLDDPEDATSSPAHGATHAWAQIKLPGAGWIDVDPTHGTVGKRNLVTVAVARDPRDTIPLFGTYYGISSDHLGMEVNVSVTSEGAEPHLNGFEFHAGPDEQ